MEHEMKRSKFNGDDIPDVALERVMSYIDDPGDREALSLVCRRWRHVDSLTRKHVTVAFCYSATPDRLSRRFSRLESLKVKGKPRAAMYGLLKEDWGGYAGPWMAEIARGTAFHCLKALHLRRMIVADYDIGMVVAARGHALHSLHFDKCSAFSTHSLRLIATSCRCLRTLFLDESSITEHDTDWFHDLALTPNSPLETLSFYMTDLRVLPEDLALLARNCKSLISLKISECDVSELVPFFQEARSLQEFGGGSFNTDQSEADTYRGIVFPQRLSSLSLIFMGVNEMPTIFPLCGSLKKLDLQCTILNTEGHCHLIQLCPNLETLEVTDVIGDRGLEVVARTCKKLRRLRIERGEDEQLQEEEQGGKVSQVGLSALSAGCTHLEYLAVYVSDITNSALQSIASFNKNLRDFRLVLLDKEETIADLPLDTGVRDLLRGCTKLRRFSFYVRPGGLSDTGLRYVGEYSSNVRYMLLGNVGDSDQGLLDFSRGCPSLEKLELRSCCFSERALARAVLRLRSLRYVWVQGYRASRDGLGLLDMARPFWNIEFIPPPGPDNQTTIIMGNGNYGMESEAQILAYYSFAGRRLDHPHYVRTLHPA